MIRVPSSIKKEEWGHLVSVYSGLDNYSPEITRVNGKQAMHAFRRYPIISERGEEEVMYETHFRDTPFEKVRDTLEFFRFKGKKGVDFGSAGGAVCAIGERLNNHMIGVEKDKVMYDISKKAWIDFKEGVAGGTTHNPFYLGDCLNFPIEYVDFVWCYLEADMQTGVLSKFIDEAKSGASLILRHPSPKCLGMSKNSLLEKMSCDDFSETTLILRKKKK
ncbi:hypothetical protein HYT25_04620 [Candidatus Pacearchaeota archaeon]|nr:hypothetical protein [Candidatus Pacearchaeota archaeon]